jgi:hypothetical protein
MQYQNVQQILRETDFVEMARLSRRDRVERWAELLARQPANLRSILDIEYGSRRERDARRADHLPVSVAYADPVLRAAGLAGDTIGDAVEFFGLSRAKLHDVLCYCHHGLTMDPWPRPPPSPRPAGQSARSRPCRLRARTSDAQQRKPISFLVRLDCGDVMAPSPNAPRDSA